MPRTTMIAMAATLLAGAALPPHAATAQQSPESAAKQNAAKDNLAKDNAGPGSAANDDLIGRVGSIDVSAADVRRYLDLLPPAERVGLAGNPAQLAQVVRVYIADRLVLKEAREAGIDREPAVKARLDQAREALLSEAFLQSKVQVPDGYPSEAEVRAAYDANRTAFIPPRRYRLAQIFIAAPADDKTSPRLAEVLARLKAKGADFAALARQYSEARAEAAKGGDLGWLSEPIIVPEIRQAVAGLDKGAVTAPIRLKDGWHVIRVLDVQASPGEPLAFADVKATLAEQMRRQRLANERQAYLAALLQKNSLVLNEIALAKLAQSLK